MKRIYVCLPESEIEFLDEIAKKNGTTRADVIRSSLDSRGFTRDSMSRVSVALHRRLCGTLSAQQAEHAAAIAISTLSETSSNG